MQNYYLAAAARSRPFGNHSTLTDNLVSYWKLDGDVNDAHGDNDGTAENGASETTGKIGNAYSLDGIDDYLRIPDATNLNITGAISLSAWIKIAASTSYERIIYKFDRVNGYDQRGYGLQLTDGGVLQGELRNNADGGTDYYVRGTTVLDDDTWHHVVMTWTPSQHIKLYVDNSQESTSANGLPPYPIGQSTEPLYFGRILFEGTYYYGKMTIDEVGIWNKALTTDEISALYNSGDGISY